MLDHSDVTSIIHFSCSQNEESAGVATPRNEELQGIRADVGDVLVERERSESEPSPFTESLLVNRTEGSILHSSDDAETNGDVLGNGVPESLSNGGAVPDDDSRGRSCERLRVSSACLEGPGATDNVSSDKEAECISQNASDSDLAEPTRQNVGGSVLLNETENQLTNVAGSRDDSCDTDLPLRSKLSHNDSQLSVIRTPLALCAAPNEGDRIGSTLCPDLVSSRWESDTSHNSTARQRLSEGSQHRVEMINSDHSEDTLDAISITDVDRGVLSDTPILAQATGTIQQLRVPSTLYLNQTGDTNIAGYSSNCEGDAKANLVDRYSSHGKSTAQTDGIRSH